MWPELIPYSKPELSEDDITAAVDVLRSRFITQGALSNRLEEKICAITTANHATVVNSATSALHLACLGLGLGPGDVLWTSSISFVASANCGLYCGAEVDFVDIEINSYNICPEKLEDKLVQAERDGRLPKIIVCVHMCGSSCDLARIAGLRDKYGFLIIEDASHAVGAKYKGKPVGNCEYSDAAVFSFHAVKIVTSGEGGAITTNDFALSERLKNLRSHGIEKSQELIAEKDEGPWYYEQRSLGYNYRITDFQSALLLSQLDRLDQIISKKNELAQTISKKLPHFLLPQHVPADNYSSYHLFVARFIGKGSAHKKLHRWLRASNIECNIHYIPIYLHPFFRSMGFTKGYNPSAEIYYSQAVTLPLFNSMTDDQLSYIVDQLITFESNVD